MKKTSFIFSALKLPLDFLMILLAGVCAYSLRFTPIFTKIKPILFTLTLETYFAFLALGALFSLIVFALTGLYQIKQLRPIEEFFRILVATAASLLVINFSAYLSQAFFESRFILIATWILSALFVPIGRGFLSHLRRYLAQNYAIGLNRVVIIGDNEITKKIKEYIKQNPILGYRIVKLYKKLDLAKLEKEIDNNSVDDVILGNSHSTKTQIAELFNLCSQKSINFRFVPTNFQALTAGLEMETLGGFPLLEAKRTPLEGWRKIVKRIFDLIFGIIFFIFLTPIFLVVPIFIKWNSKGPIFAKMPHRIGRGEEIFFMYKFRSMVKDADKMKKDLMKLNEREKGKGPLFKLKKDPRVTKVGRILRKYRIDEFPQIINVLKGEISLVGPRAHEIEEVARYRKQHKVVFAIKPGITGLAQISGSSDLPFDEENKLDLYYIEHWTLWLDVKILLKTFIFIFLDKSAC
ncbi:sugar transferase [bacterium]|nr:MAG: sugar transferase [bacterium]